ncbi:hypothetical protein EI94DRAFT_1732288 [Lactarius quietus]|nr:hypothetical protein EI94DRAFT_1732288 [Lactarius quietus]
MAKPRCCHLDRAGMTTEKLAETIYTNSGTVAAEICDKYFEKHVIPYINDKTGLHLHCINDYTCHLRTQPPAVLEALRANGPQFRSLTRATLCTGHQGVHGRGSAQRHVQSSARHPPSTDRHRTLTSLVFLQTAV